MSNPPIYQYRCCGFVRSSFLRPDSCSRCHAQVQCREISIDTSVHPKSIVVRPTRGRLIDYNQNGLLHVGVVLNFDERGIQFEPWPQGISLPLPEAESCHDWEQLLLLHAQAERSRAGIKPYHQLNNNCNDFVARFLQFFDEKATPYTVAERLSNSIENFGTYLTLSHRLQYSDVYSEPGHSSLSCASCGTTLGARLTCLTCAFDLCPSCFPKYTHEHQLTESSDYLHPRVFCDGCRCLVRGLRFKCAVCPDYDLCERCHRNPGLHPHDFHTILPSPASAPNSLLPQ